MSVIAIQTERLCIRPFRNTDWPAVHGYMSLPAAILYMAKSVMSEAETQEYIQKQLGDDATDFALIRLADNQLIGHMVFHPWFAPRTYEIGWIVHPAYQRRGYASEAALALLRYGFEEMDLHRIIATCQPENPASYRVMEKIGMRREGHFRQCIDRGNDTWWDEYFYALLADEWQERNTACS
ncbi:MAG: GNAT family protein [Caldilineaceae bacterium]